MDMLETRLSVLEEAGQISSDIKNKLLDFVKEAKLNAQLDTLHTFITHAAMALGRIDRGETIEPVNEMILKELSSSEFNIEATALIELFESVTNYSIPDYEQGYFLMHLINVLSKENNA